MTFILRDRATGTYFRDGDAPQAFTADRDAAFWWATIESAARAGYIASELWGMTVDVVDR